MGWFSDLKFHMTFLWNDVAATFSYWSASIALKKSYRNTVEERSENEETLVKIKEQCKEKARSQQQDIIEKIMETFQEFSDGYEEKYPGLGEKLKNYESQIEKNLSDTFMDCIEDHLSVDNKEYMEILMMPAGVEKSVRLGRFIGDMIQQAKNATQEQIWMEMDCTYDVIRNHLLGLLREDEAQLERQEKRYQSYITSLSEKNEMDEYLLDSIVVAEEGLACMRQLCGIPETFSKD